MILSPIIHILDADESFQDSSRTLATDYRLPCTRFRQRVISFSSWKNGTHLRTGTASAKQRTDGPQQHGADNRFAQVHAVGNPGRLLSHAVLVLRGDEDRRRGLARRGEMVE